MLDNIAPHIRQSEWQKGEFSGAAQTYVELGLQTTSDTKSLPGLKLKREVQIWLTATGSGHGHLSAMNTLEKKLR